MSEIITRAAVREAVEQTQQASAALRRCVVGLTERTQLATAHRQETTVPPRNRNWIVGDELLRLDRLFALHTGEAVVRSAALVCRFEGTDRWAMSSAADALKRLRSGRQRCVRKFMFHDVLRLFSALWPADLEWPADIPRPSKAKGEAA